MSEQTKKTNPSRFTRAPLYLAAGLVAGYVVLTRMIPTLNKVADDNVRRRSDPPNDWQVFSSHLSDWVVANSSAFITGGLVIIAVGFALPVLFRPGKNLVWLAVLAVLVLDLVLFAGAFAGMLSGLLREANDLGHR